MTADASASSGGTSPRALRGQFFRVTEPNEFFFPVCSFLLPLVEQANSPGASLVSFTSVLDTLPGLSVRTDQVLV